MTIDMTFERQLELTKIEERAEGRNEGIEFFANLIKLVKSNPCINRNTLHEMGYEDKDIDLALSLL